MCNFPVCSYFICFRWARNVKKLALNSGQQTTTNKGKFVYARETGPDCGCKSQCFQEVNEEHRKWIIDQFNELGNYNLQNVYLRGLITAKDIQRVGARGMYGRADGEKQQKRKCSFNYWVPTKTLGRVKVESSPVLSF